MTTTFSRRAFLWLGLGLLLFLLGLLTLGLPESRAASPDLVELPGSLPKDLGQTTPPTPNRNLASEASQVVVTLLPRNEAQLDALAKAVQDPASLRYRQPVTDAEWEQNFAPDRQVSEALKSYLQAQGLSLSYEDTDRLLFAFKGSRAKIDTAFGTRSEYRSHSGQSGLINVLPLKFPANLAPYIKGVSGFDTLHQFKTLSKPATPITEANTPASVRTAYNIPDNLTGAGVKVGITLWGAPNQTDMSHWVAAYGHPLNLMIIGNNTPATGSTLFEANMDVQLVHLVAPQSQIRFYVGASPSVGDMQLDLAQAINDNVHVLSNSWGLCEISPTPTVLDAYHTLLQRAAAKGIAVFFGSGDSGSVDCNPDPDADFSRKGYTTFPASDDLVTAVGGTELTRDDTTNAWVGETGWSCDDLYVSLFGEVACTQAYGGSSGGGIATYRARPTYQSAIAPPAEPTFTNVPTSPRRLMPDISTNASPTTGITVYLNDNDVGCNDNCPSNGTSASGPFLAGMVALAAQKTGGHVGGINPFIYANYNGASWRNDVTAGFNGVDATSGWDYVTGLGSIKNATAFINAFAPTARPFLSGASFSASDAGGNNNGVIEPGETITLQIGLANNGEATATAVSASLSVVSGNVSLLNATSAYSNIASNAAVTNTTLFSLSVSGAQPCGQKIVLRQTVTYSSGYSFSQDISLATGTPSAGALTTFSYSGPPLAIPDNNQTGITSTISVASTARVGDLNVKLNVTHAGVDDLRFILTSPGGKQVLLFDASASNGNLRANFTNTVLDDEAAISIYSGTPPFTGSYKPDEPLSSVDGEALAGNWQLHVADVIANDAGTLNSWELQFIPLTYTCASVSNPTPAITAISPTTKGAGQFDFTLGITGTNFIPGSVVRWNGADRTPTTYLNSSHLQVTIPASDITNPGSANVQVFNPAPGGGLSNVATFTIGGCDQQVVIKIGNDTSCGSFRNAITVANGNTPANKTVTFSMANQSTINLSGSGVTIGAGVKVSNPCGPNGPVITLNGSGLNASDSLLTLNGATLEGLRITGSGFKLIKANAGRNQLKCVVVSK